MSNPETPAFLDAHSAAIFLGLRPRTLDRWRWAGVGPRFRRHGGRVVYSVADLLAWSDAQVRASTSSDPVQDAQGRSLAR